jgi:hypothetical protein
MVEKKQTYLEYAKEQESIEEVLNPTLSQRVKSIASALPKNKVKKVSSIPTRKIILNPSSFVRTPVVLSREQNMMQQLFAGERTFGTGRNLPDTSNRILRSGHGLINNGDYGQTGNMFGVRRMR